jgi:hypothetical protein
MSSLKYQRQMRPASFHDASGRPRLPLRQSRPRRRRKLGGSRFGSAQHLVGLAACDDRHPEIFEVRGQLRIASATRITLARRRSRIWLIGP